MRYPQETSQPGLTRVDWASGRLWRLQGSMKLQRNSFRPLDANRSVASLGYADTVHIIISESSHVSKAELGYFPGDESQLRAT